MAVVLELAFELVRVNTMGCWKVAFLLLLRWMEGDADVLVEEDRMAEAGMGELGKDRDGAAGGSVDAMVASTETAGLPTTLDGDGIGVDAML